MVPSTVVMRTADGNLALLRVPAATLEAFILVIPEPSPVKLVTEIADGSLALSSVPAVTLEALRLSMLPPCPSKLLAETFVEASDLADDLDSADAGKNGYSTENQQYLHIQIENNDASESLTLYAYNYAFGAWSILYIPVGGGTTAEATYVAAAFTSINGKKMVTVPIHGIDRIGFVHDGSVDANFVVRAACSTF